MVAPFVEHYWFVTHPDDRPVELRVDVFVRPGTAPDPVFDQYAADLVAAAGAGS